jgi:hypothetical protein
MQYMNSSMSLLTKRDVTASDGVVGRERRSRFGVRRQSEAATALWMPSSPAQPGKPQEG